MWNDLWAIGLTGAAVGGAVGWPLLRRPAHAGVDGRRLGLLILLGAGAAALIALNHSGATPAPTRRVAEHVLFAANGVFWALLVIWMRSVTGRALGGRARLAMVAAPLLVYAGMAAATMPRTPPFAWLLPLGASATGYVVWLWRRNRDALAHAELVARVVGFAVLMNVAQAVRTIWRDVEALREVVPLAMTAGFLSIATLGMRALLSKGTDSGLPTRVDKTPVTDGEAARILRDLDRGMREARWHRDRSLTLAALAARLSTRPQILSHVLNGRDGRGFNEVVAAWRVSDAKAQLADPGCDGYTIDGIAETAGFASRSAFYKSFRALEGCTPTAFRRGRPAGVVSRDS